MSFFFGKDRLDFEQSMKIHDYNSHTNGVNISNPPSETNISTTTTNVVRSERASTIQVIPVPKNVTISQKKEENPPQLPLKESELMRRKSTSYLQTIQFKEEEVRKREEEIKSLKEQLSRLRPTPTKKPIEDPAFPINNLNNTLNTLNSLNNNNSNINTNVNTNNSKPSSSQKDNQFVLDLRNVNNEELAIKLATESMDACISEIERLNRRLASQKEEIENLKRDLHGCRIRNRAYTAMVQRGAEIPEYTIFIEQNRK